MPEEFCQQEPDFDSGKRFIELVKAHDAPNLEALLTSDQQLLDQINAPWFHFDSPAIVQAKHDLATVDTLLKHGANIDERSSWWAGSFGVLDGVDREQFDALVARGATIGINNAAEQGDVDLVRQLLADDPTAANRPAGDGQRPLHVAATPDVAELLLQSGADLEARDVDHFATPAQYQVVRPDVCRWLISQGAQPDVFMACALGDRELVEQIVLEDPDALSSRVGHCRHTNPVDGPAGGHIYQWGLRGATTALEVAREFQHQELYDWLFQLSPAPQQFLAALWDGDEATVARIMGTVPDVLVRLDEAASSVMARAAWAGNLPAVKLLFACGFDPHATGVHHSTPLDRASFHGYRDIVEFLLEHDLQPPLTVRNEFGGTPLGTCIYGSVHSWIENTDHAGTARALIEAGAPFDESWIPTENPVMDDLLREFLKN